MNQRTIQKAVLAVMAIQLLTGVLRAGVDEVRNKIDSERISLDLKSKPLVKVLQVYATLLGVEVHIQSCEPQRPVSVTFENITVRTSLNAICESAGLRWSIETANPPVLLVQCQSLSAASPKKILRPMWNEGKPAAGGTTIALVHIKLQEADLKKVLSVTADLMHAQLVMDDSLDGKKVTLESPAIYLSNFLNTICSQVKARCQVINGTPPLLTVEKAH